MADTYDLLTVQESRDALPGGGTPDATKLAMLTTAVSRALDKLCGPIVVRAMPTRTVYMPAPGAGWSSDAIQLAAPAGSLTFAFSAVTVTEYVQSTATVLTLENVASPTVNDYLLIQPPNEDAGLLVRRSTLYNSRWYGQQVTVAYSAGRYANTAAVGAEFKQAAKETLRHNWAVEQGFASFNTDAVPVVGSSYTVPKKVLGYLANELVGMGLG